MGGWANDPMIAKQEHNPPEVRPQPPPRVAPPNSLGILALLTSAVVVMTRGSDYFSLWDSMIGLIIVTVAAAYRYDISVDRIYRVGFSLIVGAGLMLITGPFVESLLYAAYPSIEYDGPLLHTRGKILYDTVFVGLWAAFAAGVYLMIAHHQKG